jgi:hypothetical protein
MERYRNNLNRREFVVRLLGLTVVAPTFVALLASCSGDGESSGSTCAGGAGTTVTVRDGHSHNTETLTQEEIRTAEEGDYDLLLAGGPGDHTHQVSLTADEFSEIASGLPVIKNSGTGGGHIHPVQIQC